MTLRLSHVLQLLGIAFGALIIAAACGAIWLLGAVKVHDPDHQVASAQVVTGDGRTQPLYRFPGRLFYTVPRLEGTIEVRCRTGKQQRAGYVTTHFSTEVEVVRGSDCELRQLP